MLEDLSASDIAAEVNMVRASFEGAILLVEGATDCRFFERFAEPEECFIMPCHSRENAVEAILILNTAKVAGLLAIVDSDFGHLVGFAPPAGNIVTTDVHDLELLIIGSEAFKVVMDEYASQHKLAKFCVTNELGDLRTHILKQCEQIGILRFVSERDRLNLRFAGLNYKNFIDKDTLTLNMERVALNVINNTEQPVVKVQDLLSVADNALEEGNYDLWQLCCGHDFTEILAIGLRRCLGNQQLAIANPENLEAVLRMAYDSRALKNTKMYAAVRAWEANNVSYQVFSCH